MKISAIGLAIASVVAVALFLTTRPERPSYVSSYFFDESRFALVRPGMSPDEVRDLIGPPLWRSKLSGRDEFIWTYSSMPAPVREWTGFEVRFDASRRSTSAKRHNASQDKDPETGQYRLAGPRPPQRPRILQALQLNMIQGEAPRFGVGEERFLIQVMASWCTACTAMRPKVEALLADADSRPIKLMLISIDETEEPLRRYLREHHIEHPVAWDPRQSLPGFDRAKGIPKYALLQDGMLCWFDFEHPEIEDQLADLSWFLRYPDFRQGVIPMITRRAGRRRTKHCTGPGPRRSS
jgi:outer membrane protein assembly factor BamE (lipoprotein component of BamABCDE complex)